MDEESAFSYYGSRYLAVWLGRWITNEPLGMSGGSNLYAHVCGNPIKMYDPSGLARESSTPVLKKRFIFSLSIGEIWPVGDAGPSITY